MPNTLTIDTAAMMDALCPQDGPALYEFLDGVPSTPVDVFAWMARNGDTPLIADDWWEKGTDGWFNADTREIGSYTFVDYLDRIISHPSVSGVYELDAALVVTYFDKHFKGQEPGVRVYRPVR